METNNNYYCTYKFFSNKHRRMSAFAREKENEIEIVLWECDRADSFTKAYARNMYENYISTGDFCYHERVRVKQERKTVVELQERCAKPIKISIPKGEKNIKEEFLDYMESNYLKAYPRWKMVGHYFLSKSERDQLKALIKEHEEK